MKTYHLHKSIIAKLPEPYLPKSKFGKDPCEEKNTTCVTETCQIYYKTTLARKKMTILCEVALSCKCYCVVHNKWSGLRAALFGYYDPPVPTYLPDMPSTRRPVNSTVADNTRSVGVPYKSTRIIAIQQLKLVLI